MLPSLYHYPEIYATLLAPDAELRADVDRWIETWLDAPVASVMDPACGPGTWLVPFAERGLRVAGNDVEAAMIRESRRRLRRSAAELIVGDMRQLVFQTGPFDVALNLHASVSHLPDDAAVIDHLRAVRGHLRPGGLYFLGVVVLDGDEVLAEPEVIFQSPPVALPSGGTAAVLYESVRRDPPARQEHIRLLLLTKGVPGCPEVLREEYDLLTFPVARLREILDLAGGFDLLAVHAMLVEGRPEIELAAGVEDVTLVLRAR